MTRNLQPNVDLRNILLNLIYAAEAFRRDVLVSKTSDVGASPTDCVKEKFFQLISKLRK